MGKLSFAIGRSQSRGKGQRRWSLGPIYSDKKMSNSTSSASVSTMREQNRPSQEATLRPKPHLAGRPHSRLFQQHSAPGTVARRSREEGGASE